MATFKLENFLTWIWVPNWAVKGVLVKYFKMPTNTLTVKQTADFNGLSMICPFDYFFYFFALCKFKLQKLEKSTYLLEIEWKYHNCLCIIFLHDSPLCLCLRLDQNHNKQTIKHKITNDLECKQKLPCKWIKVGKKVEKVSIHNMNRFIEEERFTIHQWLWK